MARAATRATLSTNSVLDVLNENIASYKRDIGLHSFDAVAGYTVQGTQYNNTNREATNFATDNIQTLNAGTASAVSSIEGGEPAAIGFLFRVNYAFQRNLPAVAGLALGRLVALRRQ